MTQTPDDSDDIIMRPDGEWCFRCDLKEYGWTLDGKEIIPFNTDRWRTLVRN